MCLTFTRTLLDLFALSEADVYTVSMYAGLGTLWNVLWTASACWRRALWETSLSAPLPAVQLPDSGCQPCGIALCLPGDARERIASDLGAWGVTAQWHRQCAEWRWEASSGCVLACSLACSLALRWPSPHNSPPEPRSLSSFTATCPTRPQRCFISLVSWCEC